MSKLKLNSSAGKGSMHCDPYEIIVCCWAVVPEPESGNIVSIAATVRDDGESNLKINEFSVLSIEWLKSNQENSMF